NDKDLSPYIEILNFSPENITQKSLGTLLGCFEIKDDSDDSAYIVNFLSSVVKKEYFLNPKRPAAKSFEAALHKVNLALSEIANHNNISWIGKFDATLCVIEKYSIHFSVTGDAKILLFRDGELMEISEGLASNEGAANPIKTFTDISSGKLKHGDKIIITSEDLFHVLSTTDLKRTASKFSNEKFSRFINTALINELAIAGTIIVDVEEKTKTSAITTRAHSPIHTEAPAMIENAFSGQVFEKQITQKQKPAAQQRKRVKRRQPHPPQKQPDLEQEYVDKKTGHIYLKDDKEVPRSQVSPFDNLLTEAQERFTDLQHWLVNNAKGKWSNQSKKLLDPKKLKELMSALLDKTKGITSRDELEFDSKQETVPAPKENQNPPLTEKPDYHNLEQSKSEIDQGLKNVLPNINRLKDIFSNLTKQQRAFALILLIVIIFGPILIGKIKNQKSDKNNVNSTIETVAPKTAEEIYSQEKNIYFSKGSENIYSDPEVIGIKHINKDLFAVKNNSIIMLTNDKLVKEYPFPTDFTEAKMFTYMESLNFFFVLTETNQILGFNSISKSFQHYVIDIPENAEIKDIGSFLYYIYLADSNSDQIYRYLKGTGSFGEKSEWMKEDVNLADLTDIDVDGRITVITGNNPPLSFYKNKKYSLIFENSKTPISYDKIHSTEDMENFYILDKENSRIVKFNEAGQLIAQYHNEKIKDSFDFTITPGNIIYLKTTSGIQKITLE
ncbi:hypothetical protein ACFL2R_04060, partial [Patescibacteria group bacterium]